MKEAIDIITGGKTAGYYLGNGFWIIFAVCISLLILVLNRSKDSSNTPKPFSWKFFLLDNSVRTIITMMFGVILLRFAPAGIPAGWMIVIGFGLTFGFDQLIVLAVKSGDILPEALQKILESNRQKYMAKNENQQP
jgi:hypothetical protein